ncbi:MAG: hypothetical protein JG765_753 [Cereibacter sp.]|jgi:glycosyltransferase involved in cell wall biosynthesis|nr:hypothetical protein [Cereibacter sp.]
MTVSLIVVSRHRPEALARAITAIRQQDLPRFELIVVADPASAARVSDPQIKLVTFDEANISAARNLGLAQAAGDVVAFLDDDAVPEPTWLRRLTDPFADPRVTKAGGFTRGRNGISFQWRACELDRCGEDHALAVDPEAVTLLEGTTTRAPKVQGANCAFRTEPLRAIGGFDPAFRFYLDEADVCLRLPGLTAIVPLAEVHHGFAESAHRRADRAPRTLREIGASTMVFLRRHAPEPLWPGALARLREDQRRRLLRHMVAGRLEPRDLRRLLGTLEQGLAEGLRRPLAALPPVSADPPGFRPLDSTGPRPGLLLAGPPNRRRALEAEAAAAAGERIVTLFLFGKSLARHRHSYDPRGFWLQTGGIFGQSLREGPLLRRASRDSRISAERQRLASLRPMGEAPR